jgi:hypothetical protein
MVAKIKKVCKMTARRVVRHTPPKVGTFSGWRKPRMRFFLALDSVLETIVEDEGETRVLLELGVELEGAASTMGGKSLSAGCLAGSTIPGVRLRSTTSCPCIPSTKPISPHFNGKGSTSDRDSCSGEDEEAIDAILSIYHQFMEPAPSSLTK